MKNSLKSSPQRAAGKGAMRLVRADKAAAARRHWKRLFAAYAFIVLLALPVVIFAPFPVFVRGVIAGITLGLAPTFWLQFLIASGIAVREMGAAAEQWTASELSKFDPKRWFVLHDLPSPAGNIDHVAIGPDSILVIETKWTSAGDNLAFLSPGARQAEANARVIRTHLAAHGVVDRNVIPVLVVWGPGAASNDSEPYLDDDTTIVMGAHATTWREHFEQADNGTEPERIALTAIATPIAGAAKSFNGLNGQRSGTALDGHDADGAFRFDEWNKHGKHRLYANLTGVDESLGWIDLPSGETFVQDRAPDNTARALRKARQEFLTSARKQTSSSVEG